MKLFEIFGIIDVKSKDAEKQLKAIDKQASKTSKSFGKSFGKIAKKAAVAGAAIGAVAGATGYKLINLASDATEMQNKFDTVFGSMSDDAEAWSKDFRNKVGGSRTDIKEMLAATQDMMSGFGATTEEAFGMSTKIQELGTDLASFQNLQGGAAEGVERLQKGLMGETENLKALGIVINQTVMEQKMQELGYKKTYKELTELEKMEIRYAIAVDQSKNAIGDAEETNDSFANVMRDIKGQLKDAAVELGQKLLPKAQEFALYIQENMPLIKEKITSAFDKAIELFLGFRDAIQWVMDKMNLILPVISGLTAAILAQMIISKLTAFYKAWTLATQTQTTMQWLLNAAMSASPLGWIAIAIGAVIAVGVLLWKNWDTVKKYAYKLWGGLKDAFGKIKSFTINAFDAIKDKVTGAWDTIAGGIKGSINSIIRAINTLIGGMNKISIRVPKWVPGIGGKSFGVSIPKVPYLARGTEYFSGGYAMVGEQGPELVSLPRGSSVKTNRQTNDMINQPREIIVPVNIDGKEFARVVAPYMGKEQATRKKSIARAKGVMAR